MNRVGHTYFALVRYGLQGLKCENLDQFAITETHVYHCIILRKTGVKSSAMAAC